MPFSNVISTASDLDHWEEWTVEERAEIIDELNRIIADSAFKNSKRCLMLFQCLVSRSLAGDHEGVKERTLGVEVFGRDPNYDTAIDPVVRLTATEIRKRLAQWYQEPVHHQRVRVRLTPGAYLLKFEFVQPGVVPEPLKIETEAERADVVLFPEAHAPRAHQVVTQSIPESDIHTDVAAPSLVPAAPSSSPAAASIPVSAPSGSKWIWLAIAMIVVATAVVLTSRNLDVFRSRNYLVWKPLLNTSEPLIISIPDVNPPVLADGTLDWQLSVDAIAKRVAPANTSAQNLGPQTPMADAEASENITKWLTLHDQLTILRGSSALTLRDLRNGPVVLIGGYNPWSLILLSNLRYSMRVDRVTKAKWIQDAQNTSKRDWLIDGNDQPQDVDYAVITRLVDPETGHWILALGGLRQQGTQAAADLLVDSQFVQLIPAQVRSKGNFQIVLKTNIINGSAGPPQVLAVRSW